MSAHSHDFGQKAETIAAAFLINKGFRIVAQNFRFKQFEVDLIVKNDKIMVFVEVKARKNNLFGNPEASVNARKIAAIRKVSLHYLRTYHWHKAIRFDIIAIIGNPEQNIEIFHLEDVF